MWWMEVGQSPGHVTGSLMEVVVAGGRGWRWMGRRSWSTALAVGNKVGENLRVGRSRERSSGRTGR
jgi:hypothetical protein